MRTKCEYCGRTIVLNVWEDILVGAECKCGEYVTRYTDEFAASADWLD